MPRVSSAGVLSALLLVVTWTTLTVVHAERLVPTRDLAASPARVSRGDVWLLVTSGLLVQRPIVLSLVAFGALALLVIVACGPTVLWLGAIVGHVFSTVITYGLLAAARLVDHTAFASLQHAPDYGVSAISAAWLGAIASASWRRRGSSRRGKAAVALSCAAVALGAWMIERHVQGRLTFLDSEHVFAFALGVLVVWRRWSIASHSRLRFVRPSVLTDPEGGHA